MPPSSTECASKLDIDALGVSIPIGTALTVRENGRLAMSSANTLAQGDIDQQRLIFERPNPAIYRQLSTLTDGSILIVEISLG